MTTVAEIAAGTAAAIRENGHYRRGEGKAWTSAHPRQPCCVVLNPAVEAVLHTNACMEYFAAVAAKAELEPWRGPVSIGHWSDTTPTDVVLAALDEIAVDDA